LIKAFFGCPDFTDTREQFVKMIPAAGVFEAFVVHDETFD
jgi:hypothetical protein